MKFSITQEQELFRETTREFAQSEITPLASKLDWEAHVPQELFTKLPSLGLFSISIPAEYGGAGADFLSLVLASEELSKVSGSLGAQVSLHNAVVCEAISSSTNTGLKSDLLPKIVSGKLGAFSFDPRSTISGTINGRDIILNGTSEFVMNAVVAGVFLVLLKLKDKSEIIVAFSKDGMDENSGFKIGAPKKMMGLRASGTSSISFENFHLPLSSSVFEADKTRNALNRLLAKSRLAVSSQALGIAQAALDSELSYSNERSQFNTKIGRFYAVQDFIATDEISIETARNFTYGVASNISSDSIQRDSCIAKISSSNAAVQAARHSIRIHGGYGFIRDYPVERYLRDARVTQLYLESNETLKAKIAESLLGV